MGIIKLFQFRSLPLQIRLFLVVVVTSLFVFIDNLDTSIIVFIISLFLLIINGEIKYKYLLLSILLINSLYMVLGNWLFSPIEGGGKKIFFFMLNNAGLERGIVGALKRNSMILVSFTWLSSISSIEEIFKSFSFIKSETVNKFLLIFLKWIQNFGKNFREFYFSISLRGFPSSKFNLKNKLIQLRIILSAMLNRMFYDIGKMTFLGESHHIFKQYPGDGSIKIQKLNVGFSQSNSYTLKEIDLHVKKGEFIFITGPNGSGKSTLLKSIAGYIPKIEGYKFGGSIFIENKEVDSNTQVKELSRSVKIFLENPENMIMGLTVAQELSLVSEDNNEIEKILKEFKIHDIRDQETTKLSGGQQVRLVLASILASKTRVLLLDSSLSQLDPRGRSTLIKLLGNIKNQDNITMVVTDSHLKEFLPLIDRLVYLNDGQIEYSAKNDKNNSIQVKNFLLDNKMIFTPEFESHLPLLNKVIIEMNNVSQAFSGKPVLNKLCLKIYSNECLIISGPNGCGKSTAMMTLLGLIKQKDGEIKTNDKSFGYVFQNTFNQILESYCEDELILGPKIKKWSENVTKNFVKAGLDLAGVNPRDETLTLHNSKLKFLVSKSINLDVDVMIFDEPSVFFDYIDFQNYYRYIKEILFKEKSVIIISHDSRLFNLGSRFLFMDMGKIIYETKDVDEYKKYVEDYYEE